jgi:hypothetical protein
MQIFDHNIGFWEKRQFFRRKLSKIAENCDDNIDPCIQLKMNLTAKTLLWRGDELESRGGSSFFKTTSLHPGGIRSHDPYVAPVSSVAGGDDATRLRRQGSGSFLTKTPSSSPTTQFCCYV